MVNPYALRDQRVAAKPQIQLGQSSALKKFEKFQNKYNTTTERQTNKTKKNSVLDSSADEDDYKKSNNNV